MEFVGITRVVDGKEVDLFVARCAEHNYYYRGKPPITSGCHSCWETFFISQWAENGGKPEDVDKLESIIRRAAELDDKGEFDFKPVHPEIKYEDSEDIN